MLKTPLTDFLCVVCVSCRHKMVTDNFTHQLVLASVRLSDAGEYTAVAGSSMSKAQLGVEGRDIRITEPLSRDITVSYSL